MSSLVDSFKKGDQGDENDLFYFESDHLALRGNEDYSELVKTMYILEAQRTQALEDYNRVVRIKKEALADPMGALIKLKSNGLGVPALQRVIDVPRINWAKYPVKIPQQYIRQVCHERPETETHVSSQPKKTHSKSWTTDEQRKLEELLIKYPPEAVEARRIKKIASELGTRTVPQVSSRLQKYYLKLLKAGLPIPGPLPKKVSTLDRRNAKRSFHKLNYTKPSTFFPNLDIPVVMNESEEVPGPSNSNLGVSSSNYLLPNYNEPEFKPEFKIVPVKSDDEIQLEMLQKIKIEKSRYTEQDLHRHHCYKCDYCEDEPIEGTRWHCSTCINRSVDYCTDCMLSQLLLQEHPIQHKFILFRNNECSEDVIKEEEYKHEGGSIDEDSIKNQSDSSEDSDSSDDDDDESNDS